MDGFTTTFRTHLKGEHLEEYERVINVLNLKHANNINKPLPGQDGLVSEGPFELDEWIKRLIRWIAVDDQVFSRRHHHDYVIF